MEVIMNLKKIHMAHVVFLTFNNIAMVNIGKL